ncbi:MAG TPA: nucleoside deaminase [Caldisericia bacterium]|nr:nucleoside deaminase [Caldisericia bacterium]HPF49329.1 nucleoside deaminase [Caldisericia bacterium]HPI83991.1 nucleoside deaminase [Caldisericia bacterium]HPQ93249.1 nucleoside deaminase [Caldisericia bacterium]HRV75369.1 nucleoside deaminase [Caldisericia bacterium]
MIPAFMMLAFEQAYLAREVGEMPIGAVVVKDSKVIGRGYNNTLTNSDPTCHAEIMAIRDATKNISDWRLTGCSIYVTLEPCPMCVGAILLSRISKIYYAAYDPKDGACGSRYNLAVHPIFGHSAQVVKTEGGKEASELIRDFFRSKRKK